MMDEYIIKKNGYICVMVGWMSGLVSGLQNHPPRFESGTDLSVAILLWGDNLQVYEISCTPVILSIQIFSIIRTIQSIYLILT